MAARIPRKKGQPAKSDKHSDLYTDEDPKGTIKGLQFKNKRAAALSVAKIKRSNRSHAHKTQAAIAMEQRAKVAKKTEAAGVYRKFIEEQKRERLRRKMLRPNTELLKEEVNQSLPRFVDVSKGTLTSKTKRSKALNKATLRKKSK